MAAQLTQNAFEAAAGNVLSIAGSGLTPGPNASLVLQGQGAPLVTAPGTVTIALPAVFAADGTSVTFTVPDGLVSGTLLITANDLTTVTADLRIVSQYLQSAEYQGEGVDLTSLAAGELDVILRHASAYADSWIGDTLRLMPALEQHTWRPGSRRIYPYRFPITAINSFVVVIANNQQATFLPTDIVINNDLHYLELQSTAMAGYTLIGAVSTLGVVANIVQIAYNAGFAFNRYPQGLKAAVAMIATELLTYRNVQRSGMAGFDRIRQGLIQYDRRQEPFAIPLPAKELLRPYAFRRVA